MLHYARADTHFLIYIYDRLRKTLLKLPIHNPSPKSASPEAMPVAQRIPEDQLVDHSEEETESSQDGSDGNPQKLHPATQEVMDRSAEVSLRLYERELYDPEGKGSTGWIMSGTKVLGESKMNTTVAGAVWKSVHAWRDSLARSQDESTQ